MSMRQVRLKRFCLLLLFALVPQSARSEGSSAESAFEQMRGLVGSWSAKLSNGKEVRVSYRLVSSDSALVETYTTPSGKETLTIYHLDGVRLLATHYCGQGNQPRLALHSGSTPSRLLFDFVDATNLKSPQAPHLHPLELVLQDADHFTKAETYRGNGKDTTETLHFARALGAHDKAASRPPR